MAQLPRRKFLHLTAGAAALPATSRIAKAQRYPTKPIRLLVGFPAGNAPDIIARLIGRWLSERLGQQFIVDDRPGAASNIAAEEVVRASPDGYALFLAVLTNAINASLYPDLKFNFIQDFAPIASIATAPFVMVVNPSFPAKTVPEFIAHAKANPGKINMASGGNGSAPHVFGELFKIMTGVDLVHVPYRGPYMPDLLGGQVQLAFNPIPQAIEYIGTGKLDALAVTTAARLGALPNIPALDELCPAIRRSVGLGSSLPRIHQLMSSLSSTK